MRLKPGTMLHKCADCDYWEPALTYFGEPTGQGSCRFAPARNRRGDLLRECEKYREGEPVQMSKPLYESEPLEGRKPQAVSELEHLIVFWRDSLAEHRLLMSPSTVYLVEQTIKSLEELANLAAGGRAKS